MAYRAEHIPNKRRTKEPKKHKSEKLSADPSEYGQTYGIDRLNLGGSANDWGKYSKWLLAKRRESQMSYKKDKYNSIKHECNVLSTM